MRHSPLWIALVISPAIAEIIPAAPTEEEIFRTGEPCLIEWDADTQPGGWKTMRIDLMSGTPPSASIIENVAESVGTTGADPATFSWTCPPVDFDGPVYSYMFTPIDSLDPPEYSSQFTITGFTGSVDIPGAASASVPLSATSTDVEVSIPTDIADASQGAIHLGHQNSANGEEMLEDIPAALGGSDSPTRPAVADGPNFLSQAIASGPVSPAGNPLTEAGTGARFGHAMAPMVPDSGVAAIGDVSTPDDQSASSRAPGSTTRSMASGGMSSTASASSSPSLSARNSTATSSASRSSRHEEGMVRVLLFAFCVGHFVL